MRVSHQLSVALAIGSAAGWAVPTFTLPAYTIPGLPTNWPTKTATSSSKKTVATTSSVASSIQASSIVSGSATSSPSKSVPPSTPVVSTVSSSTSKPSVASSSPAASSSMVSKSSPSSPLASSSSSVKPSGSASVPLRSSSSSAVKPSGSISSSGNSSSPPIKPSDNPSISTSTPSVKPSVSASSPVGSSSKPTASVSSTVKPSASASSPVSSSSSASKSSGSPSVKSSAPGCSTSPSVKPSASASTPAGSSSSAVKPSGSVSTLVSSSSSTKTPVTSLPPVKPSTPVGSGSSTSRTSAVTSSKSASGSVSTESASATPSSKPSGSGAVSSSTSSKATPSSVLSTPSKPASSSTTLKTSASTTASAKVSSLSPSSTPSKKPSSIVSSIGSVKPSPTASPYTYVNTTSGKLLCGTASNVTGVTQCLGIPFAQPPVGNLRFAPPIKYTGSGIVNATTYGADCACTIEDVPTALGPRLYGLLGSLAQVGDPLSEDCLFVNVWMKSQKSTAPKPVLVWIYGGGFEFGGSGTEVYSGKYFAQDEDVVFVSLNYRTNILGFSGAPGQTQNIGLLDQRMAIEWVRDNIAAFGGDPSRITIFGQSAGGASVDYYNYIWTKDPIIAGQIPMSGTATAFAARTASQSATSWYNVTTTVGCGNSSTSTDDAILACMRTVNVSAIEAAAKSPAGLSSLLGNFGPVIDNTTVFTNYTDLAVKGEFIKKPTLTGNLNYESGLFILIAAGAGQTYPQSLWDYIETQTFTCPQSRLAEYAANAGVPTWRYYYSGMYPNELIPTANISQAWHTAELPNLFGTTEEIERNAGSTLAESANTQPQAALAKYIRHAWATFASDPEAGLGGAEFGWPQYSASGNNVVFLGQDNQTVAFGPSTNITGPCQL